MVAAAVVGAAAAAAAGGGAEKVTTLPFASANCTGPNTFGTIESVKCSIALVFVLSENFSENTSVMSFWISGDSGASVWLMTPFETLICIPALSTTASGVSVVLSNRM